MSKRLRDVPKPSISLVDGLSRFGLGKRDAAEISKLPSRRLTINARQVLREPDTGSSEAFFVVSGLLAKYRIVSAGRRQILGLRYAGEGILPGENPPRNGLQAVMPTEVLVMQKDIFDDALRAYPGFAVFCLRGTQRHAAIDYEWLLSCGSRDGLSRVAHLLCETTVRTGVGTDEAQFVNPLTQLQMAEITGQTSINVNRMFAEIERLGLIERRGQRIHVNCWTELRRLAGFTGSYLLTSAGQ